MNDPNIDLFVRASSALTGITTEGLAPQVDPSKVTPGETPVGVQYYNQAKAGAPQALSQLLNIVSSNPTAPPETLAELILQSSNQSVAFLGKSIILMWYLGSWFDPANLQKGNTDSTVISSSAYVAGWVWPIAQTHPMGYSNYRFGYWSQPPPGSLEDFVPMNPQGVEV
jgi:hypothetical protein